MLRLASYDIVFQEVPGEVTLALNLSGCPNCCNGCHSPHLQRETGEVLDEQLLSSLLEKYGSAITCVCFMGGDAAPREVEEFAVLVRSISDMRLKTGWYSGKTSFPEKCSLDSFNFLKLGPYKEKLGGLDSKMTNQRFYRIEDGIMTDRTEIFKKSRC